MNTQTTAPQWTEAMLEDYSGVKRYIAHKMSTLGRNSHDAEDLAHELFIVATTRLDTFDEHKGNFQGWLMGIARNLIRQGSRSAGKETLVGSFQADEIHPDYHPVSEDIGTAVTNQVVDADRLSKIMRTVYLVSENPEIVDRSIVLIRECDGDIKKAAGRLDITCATLRHSYRTFQDMALLVDRSMDVYWERKASGRAGQALNVRELLSCFPDSDDADREWMRTIPIAIFRCGGWSVDKAVLVQEVGELTGYSPTTCRILINRCQQMYLVARTLAETGSLS